MVEVVLPGPMTEALHGCGGSLVCGGDRHLLAVGDCLQVGAVGPQGGDAGAVWGEVAGEVSRVLVFTP